MRYIVNYFQRIMSVEGKNSIYIIDYFMTKLVMPLKAA